MKYTPTQLRQWETFSQVSANGGRFISGRQFNREDWKPARPIGFGGLYEFRKRIALAWGVLTGRYDALDWEGH